MSKLSIDEDLIRKLAALLNETGLGEIEYSDGDHRLRLARSAPAATATPLVMPPVILPGAAPAVAAPAVVDDSNHPGAVKSPMVGTAYLSPEPGKPPFVNVGDKVTVGQTLLIIEAMKTFNPIKSTKAGTVARIVIDNARAVEFGEVLMIVE
jgi:acetyl-CoA carboxylase biotin carboxyl carrier protein